MLEGGASFVAVPERLVPDDEAVAEGPEVGAAPLDLGAALLPPAAPVDQDENPVGTLDEVLGLDGQRALPGAEPLAHVVDEPVVALGPDRLAHPEGLRRHLRVEELRVPREVAVAPFRVEVAELLEFALSRALQRGWAQRLRQPK